MNPALALCAILGAVCLTVSAVRLALFWKETNRKFKARQFLYCSAFIALVILALVKNF